MLGLNRPHPPKPTSPLGLGLVGYLLLLCALRTYNSLSKNRLLEIMKDERGTDG